MPRFYFDIRAGADLFRDEEGMECPDLAWAEREAAEAAARIVCESKYAGEPVEITIEVRDDSGNALREARAMVQVSVKSDRHV